MDFPCVFDDVPNADCTTQTSFHSPYATRYLHRDQNNPHNTVKDDVSRFSNERVQQTPSMVVVVTTPSLANAPNMADLYWVSLWFAA
jgi:hypothetical protein